MIERQMSNDNLEETPSVKLNKDIAKVTEEISPPKPRPNLRTVEAEEKRLLAEE